LFRRRGKKKENQVCLKTQSLAWSWVLSQTSEKKTLNGRGEKKKGKRRGRLVSKRNYLLAHDRPLGRRVKNTRSPSKWKNHPRRSPSPAATYPEEMQEEKGQRSMPFLYYSASIESRGNGRNLETANYGRLGPVPNFFQLGRRIGEEDITPNLGKKKREFGKAGTGLEKRPCTSRVGLSVFNRKKKRGKIQKSLAELAGKSRKGPTKTSSPG